VADGGVAGAGFPDFGGGTAEAPAGASVPVTGSGRCPGIRVPVPSGSALASGVSSPRRMTAARTEPSTPAPVAVIAAQYGTT
jgi:hypothetical protein